MGDGQLMEHFVGISVMNAREESYMDTDHGRMGGALDSMSKFEDSLTITPARRGSGPRQRPKIALQWSSKLRRLLSRVRTFR